MNDPNAETPERTPERKKLEADVCMTPHFRHGIAGSSFAQRTAGFSDLEWKDFVTDYGDECRRTREGDLGAASNMLTAQALTLDALFTDMLSQADRNLREYPEAADRYMRLALKAQAQSRATLEALAKLHQPREQTVKHVHIDNRGGQAVVADTVQPGGRKEKNAEQSHGPDSIRSVGPSLLGQDAAWHGVPVPGDEGKDAVSNARWQGRGTIG
jgi:hypothetical protein